MKSKTGIALRRHPAVARLLGEISEYARLLGDAEIARIAARLLRCSECTRRCPGIEQCAGTGKATRSDATPREASLESNCRQNRNPR
jgi:hypothetical protein